MVRVLQPHSTSSIHASVLKRKWWLRLITVGVNPFKVGPEYWAARAVSTCSYCFKIVFTEWFHKSQSPDQSRRLLVVYCGTVYKHFRCFALQIKFCRGYQTKRYPYHCTFDLTFRVKLITIRNSCTMSLKGVHGVTLPHSSLWSILLLLNSTFQSWSWTQTKFAL